jgi:hypothetical protein
MSRGLGGSAPSIEGYHFTLDPSVVSWVGDVDHDGLILSPIKVKFVVWAL